MGDEDAHHTVEDTSSVNEINDNSSAEPLKKPNVDEMFTLKVDNISNTSTNESLKEEFQIYGEIGDVYIPKKFQNGIQYNGNRGFAFIRFIRQVDMEDALRGMDGKMIDGREIRIQEAKEKRPENPREFLKSQVRSNDRRRGDDRRAYGRDRDYNRRRDSRDRGDNRRGNRRDYDDDRRSNKRDYDADRSGNRGSRDYDNRRDNRRRSRSRSRERR